MRNVPRSLPVSNIAMAVFSTVALAIPHSAHALVAVPIASFINGSSYAQTHSGEADGKIQYTVLEDTVDFLNRSYVESSTALSVDSGSVAAALSRTTANWKTTDEASFI